jgi:hypothetical protein
MSIFDNPSFYVSIFTTVCFISSEVLAFLPIEQNGILHAVLLFFSKYNTVPLPENLISQKEL